LGSNNTAIGPSSLYRNTTGNANTAIGLNSLARNTTGYYNTGVGESSSMFNTTGIQNTSVGTNSCKNLVSGSNNISIGVNAGNSYVGSESNNICIGSEGTISESNVIRIGTPGTQSSIYVPVRNIYNSLGNNLLTSYNQLLYNPSTYELVQYPIRTFITIGDGSTSIMLTNWNNLVKNVPLIHNSVITFTFQYTDTTTNPLILPSPDLVVYGDKVTIINNSGGVVGITAVSPNIIITERTGSNAVDQANGILNISSKGLAELIYIGGNWVAYGVNLTG
jgi:hypothetical protein